MEINLYLALIETHHFNHYFINLLFLMFVIINHYFKLSNYFLLNLHYSRFILFDYLKQ